MVFPRHAARRVYSASSLFRHTVRRVVPIHHRDDDSDAVYAVRGDVLHLHGNRGVERCTLLVFFPRRNVASARNRAGFALAHDRLVASERPREQHYPEFARLLCAHLFVLPRLGFSGVCHRVRDCRILHFYLHGARQTTPRRRHPRRNSVGNQLNRDCELYRRVKCYVVHLLNLSSFNG